MIPSMALLHAGNWLPEKVVCEGEGASDNEDLTTPTRKKRQQCAVACIPCSKAKSACDDIRPCSRCIRQNNVGCCVDKVQVAPTRPPSLPAAISSRCPPSPRRLLPAHLPPPSLWRRAGTARARTGRSLQEGNARRASPQRRAKSRPRRPRSRPARSAASSRRAGHALPASAPRPGMPPPPLLSASLSFTEPTMRPARPHSSAVPRWPAHLPPPLHTEPRTNGPIVAPRACADIAVVCSCDDSRPCARCVRVNGGNCVDKYTRSAPAHRILVDGPGAPTPRILACSRTF